MTQILQFHETAHPNKRAAKDFDNLIGIDEIKKELVQSLLFMLDRRRTEQWIKKHGLESGDFLRDLIGIQKLAILSGDVGCGKTMLARSVGTPLCKKLDAKVLCLESPTNIRGQGMVGELSARITSLFDQARSKIGAKGYGILIIDEADDVATSRSQMQAHHEDRAGVNVLARQIDSLSRDNINIAAILITNRLAALDPAIIRRSATTLQFERPNEEARKTIFCYLREKTNVKLSDAEILTLARITEQDSLKFTYSDIIKRGLRTALVKSIENDRPLDFSILEDTFKKISPTPNL